MSELKRSSVPHFPSRYDDRDLEGHAFLLARDIPMGLGPRPRRGESEFGVVLNGAEPEEDWILQLLDIGPHRVRTVAEAVAEFVETVGHYLGHYGEIVFEVKVDSGHPMKLMALPPGRVYRTPFGFLQMIPRADREELGRGPWVRLPLARCWRISMPAVLGGARGHRRTLRRLRHGILGIPDFASGRLDLGRELGFDFSAHRKALERHDERETRLWGSVSSLMSAPGPSSEYFFIARRLEFHRAQALLRELIIERLNEWLENQPEPVTISYTGIVRSAEIDQGLAELHRGEIGFTEALALVGI